MEKEIETRFLEINKEEIIKKLVSLGAIDLGENKLDETIFHFNDYNPENKNRFVRLRRIKDKTELTYKTRSGNEIDSVKEIEFYVSNLEKCEQFLLESGLNKVRVLEKYRHSFKLNETKFDIDTWPKIPTYIEVEGLSIEAVKNAAESLNLNWESRFDGDAKDVFKHYGYDLDNISIVTFNEFK